MSEPIVDRIQKEMVEAMKAREADKLSTLRMLKAALMEAKIAKKNVPLTEEEEIEIIARYEKKRRETLEETLKAGRKDLAAKEEAEIEVARRFLPAAADETTVRVCVAHAIGTLGASGPRDMGKVMGIVMKELKGRADGDVVSRIVKEMLAG